MRIVPDFLGAAPKNNAIFILTVRPWGVSSAIASRRSLRPEAYPCTEAQAMAKFDSAQQALVGSSGSLPVRDDDEITRKLSMLIEGECEGLGPLKAAKKFGFSKQRYFQVRGAFLGAGAAALQSRKRGPKTHYRRTAEVVRQVIRHRFLDPEASAEVIAQKLTQSGWDISIRSVQRVIAEFGLQKKTPPMSSKG